MKARKKQSNNRSCSSHTAQLILNDSDIEKLKKAVTVAILEAEEHKQNGQTHSSCSMEQPKVTLKEVLRVMIIPVKKLKVENSALSLVKMITAIACWLISRMGYLFSVLFMVESIFDAIKAEQYEALFLFPVAIILWIISKMIDATGVEIENSENTELIFGVSAFLFAIISLIISLVKKGG